MVDLCSPCRSRHDEEEEGAQEQARTAASQQRQRDLITAASERLLAQDLSPPRSLVSISVCYPENVRFNVNIRREVGRYLRHVLEDRVYTGIPRAVPENHLHECRAMIVALKDDGRYSSRSREFQGHLNRRALEAVNSRLVQCHPDLRIQYPFVTTGLMLTLVRLQNRDPRPNRLVRLPTSDPDI
ncbi:uncharacterized protein KD926_006399 [Aspergillus affinis]|uniref:uncharacterized protein n=1 Tax=Aspergillus affinis TaxID=1070780 RepID=UPI0022FDC098|nr:uncharacterized protein KD926_006399 [Aspergillus affinis]KAI9041854.1 hypothetical protein KD926_006399 [Aspergillus affinis]